MMHKILVEVKAKKLSFSLYNNRQKVENLNNTNVINTEKMIFSDKYIIDNIDLVKSFFNLVVIKKNIDTIDISINAISPIVFNIISDITNIKNINFLEDKQISYIIFEYLLKSKYIENVNCYAIPSFMFDKLDMDKNMKIISRCEVLFLSNFMEKNNFNNYSDVYYKKSIDINCEFEKIDKEDIEAFFRFNNKLRVINMYNIKEDSINYILDIIKSNNKRNIKIILNQNDNDKNIIKLLDKIVNKNKDVLKNNGIRIKVNYTKEYRAKNTLKQVNLDFFRFILIIFIIIAISLIIVFYIKNKEDTEDINKEMEEIDEIVDLDKIENYITEEAPVKKEQPKEKKKNTPPSPYYRQFSQVFSDLLKINDETVGWLKVNNTNINYPVTKHSDNDYYLHNSYYKQRNSHGWIFMDYRNKINPLDKNIIIYGHRNDYGVMFSTLKNVLDSSWYTNKSNQIITFNTINKDMKWQIFSIYTKKNTDDYLVVNFANNDNFTSYIKKSLKRSIYDFGVKVTANDNILTLSTCYNNDEYRLVVQAKLIK